MPTSPSATAMPGGAPLRSSSKRPCKYGPRDSAGRCPKKPRATSSRSKTSSGISSSKRPCKYGARINGKCPPKPKTEKVRKYETAGSQAKEAVRVLRSDTATSSQKREAVTAVGTALAVDAGKGVAREAKKEIDKALKTKQGKAAVKRAATVAATVASRTLPAATAVGVVVLAAKGIESQKRKQAAQAASRELALTEKRLGRKLTAQERTALKRQYEEFYYKQPVKNSFQGK